MERYRNENNEPNNQEIHFLSCNEWIELKFGYDVVGVCSSNLRFFQNFSFATSSMIELERYKN